MADSDDNIPPIPTPPVDADATASGVPPVEPAPAAPPAASAPVPDPTAPVPPTAYGTQSATPPPAQPTTPPPAQPVQPPANPYAQAPGAYAPAAYTPAPAGPAQGLAITSMILGIAGLVLTLFSFGFLPALAAVITGHMAQKRQPWAKPFWLTGIITGYVGVGLGLIIGIFWVILFAVGFGSVGLLGSYY